MDKRIVFNTTTPNDQGGIIPNDAIKFERFNANPVLLLQHQWEQFPVGMMTDIKLIGGKWTGVPVFHRLTDISKQCADLFEAGFIKACSIGGFSEWKTNSAGQAQLDAEGNRVCALFDLYEISLCTLPSNPDAVTLAANEAINYAKLYDKAVLPNVEKVITTLSSQLKTHKVEPTEAEKLAAKKLADAEQEIIRLKAEKAAADKSLAKSEIDKKIEDAEKEVARLKAEKETAELLKAGGVSVIPDQLPGVLKSILTFAGELLGLKTKSEEKAGPTNVAPAETPKPEIIAPLEAKDKLPTKIELKAKKVDEAKKKADEAKAKASDALEKAKDAKTKADADDATDEMKSDYEQAKKLADDAVAAAEKCDSEYKAAMQDDEDETEETSKKADKEKAQNAATGGKTTTSTKPVMKTIEQLKAEQLNLVPAPKRAAVINSTGTVTFSKLAAEAVKNPQSEEGKVFNRVMKGAEEKTPEDYAVILGSIINDPRLAAVRDNTRIHTGLHSNDQRHALMVNPKTANGGKLQELYARVKSGNFSSLTKEGTLLSARERTTLTGTDTLLASPDLFAIEWLSLVIFTLYPTTGWKKDIPIFSAQDTYNNTGLIWTNIAADPTISRGTPPANTTPYSVSDTAVALAMVPYYLPDMLFTPITMHQYRYDQMGSQWAQAFAKYGAIMDDNFINTFAQLVPSTSWLNATGVPYTISTATPNQNQFTYNAAFNGTLLNAAYNDIAAIEQVYKRQNFDMTTEKAVLLLDSIAERGILQDPDTKSLLTRFIKSGEKSDGLFIDHTEICERSRVAVFDPSTNQVKDINASIPATAQGANLGFLPSQLGIGLGMLDVFVTQSPRSYGYEMSANIRAGANALRANFNGMALYNFGVANV